MDPRVNPIGGVGIINPEGVQTAAEKRLARGDMQSKDIVNPPNPGEQHVIGKKRYMNIGSHTWLPNRGQKGLETIE